MSVILRLAVVCLCVAVASCAILCRENHCDSVNCATEVAAGNQPPCHENQVLNQHGTFCGCCPTCVTQLASGAECGHLFAIGGPPPLSQCAEGLECSSTTHTCVQHH